MVYYDVTQLDADNWQPTVRKTDKLEDGWHAVGKVKPLAECLRTIDDYHAVTYGDSIPKHVTTHSL